MELKINNQNKNFDCKSLTIQELIDFELPTKQNGIAVAVNQTVVSKNQWATFLLSPSDDILIITATQGG
jgi:sulfur carrier protein